MLKDDLKHLWDYTYPGAAARFFQDWYHRAVRSRIDPLKTFARHLKEKMTGILAHCRYPLHTSLLEGINNKSKVLKRMAYGYRDDGYFFLKIMDAFPGNPGCYRMNPLKCMPTPERPSEVPDVMRLRYRSPRAQR